LERQPAATDNLSDWSSRGEKWRGGFDDTAEGEGKKVPSPLPRAITIQGKH